MDNIDYGGGNMDSETILAFIRSHMLEIGLILIVLFTIQNWRLVVVAVLAIMCLSYLGILDVENLRESVMNFLGSLNFDYTPTTN